MFLDILRDYYSLCFKELAWDDTGTLLWIFFIIYKSSSVETSLNAEKC